MFVRLSLIKVMTYDSLAYFFFFSPSPLSTLFPNQIRNHHKMESPSKQTLKLNENHGSQKRESRLPNCEQLHSRLQLSWEIFGPQITFEVSAEIAGNDYIAFGISGSKTSSQMLGSDVALSYLDGHLGFTVDYNITDRFPCTNVNGFHRGVCPDDKVGGVDNFQILTFFREDGITRITFRRNLLSSDEGDYTFSKEEDTFIVWSVGRLNKLKEPRIHFMYPKKNVKINFGRKPEKNCFPFVQKNDDVAVVRDESSFTSSSSASSSPAQTSTSSFASSLEKAWGPLKIVNQSLTTFYARIGVSGGERGYSKSTDSQSSPGFVWYINGLLAPVIFVKRGTSYLFRVEGGSDPVKAGMYHPLYITNDPLGGYSKYREEDRKKIAVYAGIEFDRKGRPAPTAAGRLCLWSYPVDFDQRKTDSTFHTFLQFRSSLNYSCERGSPALLHWTPNASTPDVVYYQSYTQRNMGWKIIVVDDFASTFTASSSTALTMNYFFLLILSFNFIQTNSNKYFLAFLVFCQLLITSLYHL